MIKNLGIGKDFPEVVNVIIEISANSAPVKYEVDKESGCISVDRFVATNMPYPTNYGYVPETLCDDGDPLDALVITPYPIMVGSVIKCRPVGVLFTEDESGLDPKMLFLPIPKLTSIYDNVKTAGDLNPLLLDQIKFFFEHYKKLEKGKWMNVNELAGLEQAKNEILVSHEAYKNSLK